MVLGRPFGSLDFAAEHPTALRWLLPFPVQPAIYACTDYGDEIRHGRRDQKLRQPLYSIVFEMEDKSLDCNDDS